MLRRAKATLDHATNTLRSRISKRARRELALKDAEISALRKELARLSGKALPAQTTGVPVFFVVGNQKSGTTWLMRMLDAHPEVLCKGEGRFFGASWRQKSLKQRDTMRPASSLYHAFLDAEYLRLWVERSVWSRNDASGEHLDNLTRMAIDYFLAGELLKSGKRVVGDKSPLLTPDTIREISAIYPEAKVIHIIRDGRDVAVSAAHHARNFGHARKRTGSNGTEGSEFPRGQLEKLAAEWASRVGKTVVDGPELLGENYTEVRYEDLLQKPETEVQRLLTFLAVDPDEKTVTRCIHAASFERLSKGRKRGDEDPSSFFRKGVAGDWKHILTERERQIFDREAGELLARLGY
jgi:Sulfotransferase family